MYFIRIWAENNQHTILCRGDHWSPVRFTGISGEKTTILHTENKYRNYDLTIIKASDHWSPAEINREFNLLTNDFPYRKQTSNLWFNHNSDGRPMVAPTECTENSMFSIIKFCYRIGIKINFPVISIDRIFLKCYNIPVIIGYKEKIL